MADTPEERPAEDAAPDEGDATAPAADGGTSVAKSAAATPAPRPAAAPPAAARPAGPEDTPYVTAYKRRRKIPLWAVPVLVALPIWAIIYVNAVQKPTKHDPLTVGGNLYAASCASCHGSTGQGVSGPALDGGDVLKTWPNYKDHITWVEEGSAGWQKTHPGATTYGGQNHPLAGGMPAFKDTLSPGDIALIVRYEREVLSQADPTSASEKTLVACTEVAVTDPTTDCTKFTGQ